LDVEHRDLIVAYANNFKKRNTFSPKEFRFLVQRLNEYGISFERRLFQTVLAEMLTRKPGISCANQRIGRLVMSAKYAVGVVPNGR
jgi:hypothetical protein